MKGVCSRGISRGNILITESPFKMLALDMVDVGTLGFNQIRVCVSELVNYSIPILLLNILETLSCPACMLILSLHCPACKMWQVSMRSRRGRGAVSSQKFGAVFKKFGAESNILGQTLPPNNIQNVALPVLRLPQMREFAPNGAACCPFGQDLGCPNYLVNAHAMLCTLVHCSWTQF